MASSDPVAMAARDLLRDAVLDAPRGTQARIARELKVSKQTVSSWLSGDLPIHPKWFLKLESVLSMESWAFADVTGLAEALGLEELGDYELQLERWHLVFPTDDPDVLPPRAENRSYQPSPRVLELEARLNAMEAQLEAALGGRSEAEGPEVRGPEPEPEAEGP